MVSLEGLGRSVTDIFKYVYFRLITIEVLIEKKER